MFEQAVSSSLHELGLVSLEKEQRQAVEAIVMKGRDVLAVLPTGFGKSLIILPSFAGYIRLHGWKCGQSDHLSCVAFKRTYERSNLKT